MKLNNWYELIQPDENISQGDIIFNCPLFIPEYPTNELSADDFEVIDETKSSYNIVRSNIIVLTQACDLEVRVGNSQPKLSTVMVAPFSNPQKIDMGKKPLKEIAKLEKTQYFLLDPCFDPNFLMGYQVIDFEKLMSTPWSIINAFSKFHGPRLRLQSPYLEQLSQHLGNHFGRVAITENREDTINAFYDYKDQYEELRKQGQYKKVWRELSIEEVDNFISSTKKTTVDI